MATGKRNLREVLDAYWDMSHWASGTGTGYELIDSDVMIGFSTYIASVTDAYFGNASLTYDQYDNCIDSTGAFPDRDGVTVSGTQVTAIQSTVDCGLRHYWQQMQNMKGGWNGSGIADNFNSSSPSAAITAVSAGSGTYKQANISMGDMRGFEYATATGPWPSSNPIQYDGQHEYLYNTGEISIGSTS